MTKVRILDALSDEPSHGYHIAEEHNLSHGYIYTHLRELCEEGMIELVAKRGGKKVYAPTENGKLLLRALIDRG